MCFISGHDCDIRVIWQYGSWNSTCFAVDIENESVTVEEKVLKEIESEVLKANAKANSSRNRQLGIMMVKLGGHLMMRIIGGILDIREIL